jgi:hypothetical protein
MNLNPIRAGGDARFGVDDSVFTRFASGASSSLSSSIFVGGAIATSRARSRGSVV